jgi:hypothetical protein
MATAVLAPPPVEMPLPATAPARSRSALASRVVLFGATSIVFGVLWDISWHRTIGRDTFWTPAHLAIYLGGVLGGLTAAWLILRATFRGTPADRAGTVRLFGFHGPLGAWFCAWGALAMITSAPFDNWWHDAYGLDVEILSPPHTLLALGMYGIVIGALLLVLREQNLAAAQAGPGAPGRGLVLHAGGVLLAMVAIFFTEYSWPNQQRAQTFFLVSCAAYPTYLIAVARASRHRWGATVIAAVFMAINLLMLWLLPLFPGQPRLGPIYNPVTHFVPLAFPLLLVVPAFGLDLVRGWIGHGHGWRRDWLLALAGGVAFTALFCLTQWHFSAFLIGEGGQNWLFGADRHWAYTEGPGEFRARFWSETSPRWNPPATARTFAVAALLAVLKCRLGLWLGNWMVKVQR